MNRKHRTLILSLVASLASCTPHGSGTLFESGISGYSGDGTILDTSESSGLLSTRSYMITMPSFDLAQRYEKTFRMQGIPTIDGKPTGIYFFVPNGFSRDVEPNARSRVEYSLTKSDSTKLVGVSSDLGDLIWSSPANPIHYDGMAIYQLDQSFFQPVVSEAYLLHVKYTPAAGASSGQGHLYIWNGVGGS